MVKTLFITDARGMRDIPPTCVVVAWDEFAFRDLQERFTCLEKFEDFFGFARNRDSFFESCNDKLGQVSCESLRLKILFYSGPLLALAEALKKLRSKHKADELIVDLQDEDLRSWLKTVWDLN